MQIYFRKLGGVQVDTPDLGPVTKLGMGRRQGPIVTPPKAAAALPGFDGDTVLAAELGMPSKPAAPSSQVNGSDAQTQSHTGNDADSSAGTGGPVNGAQEHANAPGSPPQTEEIVGGLTVVDADMEGVATEELEYLMKRCKRHKQAA